MFITDIKKRKCKTKYTYLINYRADTKSKFMKNSFPLIEIRASICFSHYKINRRAICKWLTSETLFYSTLYYGKETEQYYSVFYNSFVFDK